MTSIKVIKLSGNKIKNIDGLKNLTAASEIDISFNQLINFDGLHNLTTL